MGQRQPGWLRAGFRRAGAVPSSPSGGGGGSYNVDANGAYSAPLSFTLADASGLGVILRQWWFDFSRLGAAASSLNIYGSAEQRRVSGGALYPTYGVFLLPDGDINVADLFGLLVPVLEVVADSQVTSFHKFEDDAALSNPGIGRQVLLAVKPNLHGTMGNTPTVFEFRSFTINVQAA